MIQVDTRKALGPKNIDYSYKWFLYDRPYANHRLQGYADESNTDIIPCDDNVMFQTSYITL